jgi:hypothetical protein
MPKFFASTDTGIRREAIRYWQRQGDRQFAARLTREMNRAIAHAQPAMIPFPILGDLELAEGGKRATVLEFAAVSTCITAALLAVFAFAI